MFFLVQKNKHFPDFNNKKSEVKEETGNRELWKMLCWDNRKPAMIIVYSSQIDPIDYLIQK